MSSKRERRGPADHLHPGEETIVELDGVVPGYTRWSSIGGVVGIVVALTLPRVLDMPFWVGVLAIVVALLVTFGAIYYGVGRPLGQRSSPPLAGPYVSLILTGDRLLLLDRALTANEPILVEAVPRGEVGAVTYAGAGLLKPQRLGYAVGTDRREFEFPRSEPVKKFVAALEG
jgi:hypothetical protein